MQDQMPSLRCAWCFSNILDFQNDQQDSVTHWKLIRCSNNSHYLSNIGDQEISKFYLNQLCICVNWRKFGVISFNRIFCTIYSNLWRWNKVGGNIQPIRSEIEAGAQMKARARWLSNLKSWEFLLRIVIKILYFNHFTDCSAKFTWLHWSNGSKQRKIKS